MKRIIDKKAVELTDDEYTLYQKIVSSYTFGQNKGEDLFYDLFEVDSNGIIIFLKPPSKRATSFEIWLFLMSIQQSQHMRILYDRFDDLSAQIKGKLKEVDDKLKQL